MSTLRNVIANVAGRVWGALMSFAFVPFYIQFLGIETYGLIGFFASMLAVFMVLDLGLSVTINRELARLGNEGADRASARILLRSLEAIYWAIGVLIGAGIVIAAPWIAHSWLRLNTMPVDQATQSVRLMGLVALLRWPVSLYTGALMGLRRHVTLNVITSASASVAGGGAVLILWLVSRDPVAFFAWQAGVAAVQIIVLGVASWRHLALSGHRARVQSKALRSILSFSAGVTGTALLSVILTQVDKAVLSKMLPLDQFGYYALASAIAMLLTTAAGALNGALFPSLVNRVARQDERELTRFYHQASEMVSALIVPMGVTLALFAPELLTLYLHDPRIVAQTQLLLSLFAIGNTLLALMIMPVALQLAHGWTSLTFYVNLVAVIVFVPLLFVMVAQTGAVGAVLLWILLTLSYFVVEVMIMHRRLLPQAQLHWYLIDVGIPVAISVGLVGSARLLVAPLDHVFTRAGLGCFAGGIAILLSLVVMPESRAWLRLRWQGYSKNKASGKMV